MIARPLENPLENPLDLVADAQCRVLVLGSLPGVRSLGEQRYYAHPRNQFWALMGAVIGRDLVALDYEARLAALKAQGVGLWDVVASAERKGSLDAALRSVRPRDLAAVVATLPALRAVAFNGASAWRLGERQLAQSGALALVPLPSSSAAHAVGLAAKLPAWRQLSVWL